MSALPALTLPYGLRDIKLTPISAAGVLGTAVDLPASQTLSFSEAEEFVEIRGDDKVQGVRGRGAQVDWELEAGGISLEAWAVLSGGTLTSSGTTPNRIKKFSKKGADARPYFKAEGQAISDSGGDVHGVLFKCKVNDTLEGEFADGEFWVTSASGIAIPNVTDDLYDLIQNETATAIV